MKIIFGKKEINLVDRDVKLANRLCRKFLKTVRSKAEQKGAPTFYFTLLTVMYLMVHDCLNATSPDTLARLLNAAYRNEENK